MLRVIANIAALMAGTTGAGWSMALLIKGGMSFTQTSFAVAGMWMGLAAALLALAGIARAEL